MTIRSAQFSLERDVPQQLTILSVMPQQIHIHNHEHAQGRDLYIGPDANVDETNGHHVLAETDMIIEVLPGDVIWGMTPDNAGCDVTVFQSVRPL